VNTTPADASLPCARRSVLIRRPAFALPAKWCHRGAALACLALGVSGAGGCLDVTSTGSFGDRTVRATGTVIAWIDETVYAARDGALDLDDRPVDATLLHLWFTEHAFDPRVDRRTLPAAERADLEQALRDGDRIEVAVCRGSVVCAGDEPETVNGGNLPPEVLPYIDTLTVALAAPPLSASSRYPSRPAQLGSDVRATLTLDEVAPRLTGSLLIDVEQGDNDPDDALEGEVTMQFTTELIGERLAECNFRPADQGVVDACDVGF
jgi:hypothetical protein